MRIALLLSALLAAACGASGGSSSGPTACVPTRTCGTQGYQCGGFTDSCGQAQACGTCAAGTACSATGGAPGYCNAVGALPPAGNPDGSCQSALPAAARAEDTSHPTTVVGDGTPASCTYAKLAAAVASGGVITFSCGKDSVIIAVTKTLQLRTDRHTVIDGGNKVTLDGGHAVRILQWPGVDWGTNTNILTLQHLVLQNGVATPTDPIQLPAGAPAACSRGWKDGQGGALFMRDGELHAVDVTFLGNQAADIGPDTGGGAVYLLGTRPATISRCSFLGNRASNAGGLGGLFATLNVYDSLFDGNEASGSGANDVKPAECPYNDGQVGSGGNGGALYSDGARNDRSGMVQDVNLCGTQVRSNRAGAFGSALFFTSNDGTGTLTIRDSWFHGNVQDNDYWQWLPGISTNASTPAPVNSTIVK